MMEICVSKTDLFKNEILSQNESIWRKNLGIGDWGLGIGDWGLGIGESMINPSSCQVVL